MADKLIKKAAKHAKGNLETALVMMGPRPEKVAENSIDYVDLINEAIEWMQAIEDNK